MSDAKPIDIDQILAHRNSGSTSHLFGRFGALPPEEALAVERRYLKYWAIEGENGLDYVGLNKANSSSKGKFEVRNLAEGDYKLIVRLNKTRDVIGYATAPIGVIIGGMTSLVVSAEKREETFARGMPTEYVEVQMRVGNSARVIMEQRVEIDQGNDSFTRVFSVNRSDAEAQTNLELVCTSYSLVKRMKVQAELFRCDPEVPDATTTAYRAAQGRRLVNAALSGGDAGLPPKMKPAARAPAATSAAGAKKQPAAKPKRAVYIHDSVPVSQVLRRFYAVHAPEKVPEVPKIVEHFLTRDKHLGVLFATLEDKYNVRFNANGEWTGPDDEEEEEARTSDEEEYD